MKIIGIIFLVSVIIIYGFSLSAKSLKRIMILETMIIFIDYVENQIRFMGRSVDKIIDDAAYYDKFDSLTFLNTIKNNNFNRDIIENCKCLLPLHKNETDNIFAFFSGVGSSDTEGEIANCRLYKGILSENLEGAKNDYNNKGKLYKSMSLLTAAALTIILI